MKFYKSRAINIDLVGYMVTYYIDLNVASFISKLKAESTPYNNELDLDVFLKLFGTDAIFLSLGNDKGDDFNRILNQLLSVINGGIDQVKHFQVRGTLED